MNKNSTTINSIKELLTAFEIANVNLLSNLQKNHIESQEKTDADLLLDNLNKNG
jgi:hypothetical protein